MRQQKWWGWHASKLDPRVFGEDIEELILHDINPWTRDYVFE